MASKSIEAVGSKGHHTFTLTVNETYVGNGAENFSKLSFSFTCYPRSYDWYGWGDNIRYSINIGGNTYSGSIPDMVANVTNTIRTVSDIQIPHNNDGTKSISISFSVTDGANQSYTSGNASASGTFDLTTILRYPQLTFDSFSSELNRIQVVVSNSLGMNIDKYQCAKVSDGTVVSSGDITSSSSATFYITGLTPNTSYSGTYKVRAYSNGGWGDWITLTNTNMKTTALPTVSSTATTGIEQASKIQFNNLNFVSKWSYVCKTYNDNTTVASGSNITTNNYEITLTSSQRSTLLNKYTGTTKPKVYWEITVVSNGTSYRVYTTGSANPTTEYTIPDTSTYQPTFTSAYITEVQNTKNTNISGSNKFIKLHNTLSLKITPMVGKYGTSGKTYTIVCGSKTKSVNYSSSAQTVTIDDVDGSTISITAVDNRGKATLVSVSITLVDYSNPVITAGTLTRQNGTGTYAYLNTNGTYTNWSGLTLANSIQEIKYRYKQTGTSTWSSYVTIATSTNTGGNWTVANLLLSTVFTNTLSYDVELYIKDRLEATTRTFNLSTADVFLWRDLANKRLGINKKPTQALDVNGGALVEKLIVNSNGYCTKRLRCTTGNTAGFIKLCTWKTNPNGKKLFGSIVRSYGYNANNSQITKTDFIVNTSNGNRNQTYGYFRIFSKQFNDSGISTAYSMYTVEKSSSEVDIYVQIQQYCTMYADFNYDGSDTLTTSGEFVSSLPTGYINQGYDIIPTLSKIYPINSIYMSVSNTNPGTLFGGTWVQLKDRFLLGAGDTYTNGATGGYASLQAHTHSIPELTGSTSSNGAHTHKVTPKTTSYGSGSQSAWRCLSWTGTNADWSQDVYTNSGTADGGHSHNIITTASTTGSTGSGATSDKTDGNMPPYLVVYMWKRTA